MFAVILVYARDSMAGESVYGPHDHLVGEGADIVEAGEPAFYAISFYRCRTVYTSKPMPAGGFA